MTTTPLHSATFHHLAALAEGRRPPMSTSDQVLAEHFTIARRQSVPAATPISRPPKAGELLEDYLKALAQDSTIRGLALKPRPGRPIYGTWIPLSASLCFNFCLFGKGAYALHSTTYYCSFASGSILTLEPHSYTRLCLLRRTKLILSPQATFLSNDLKHAQIATGIQTLPPSTLNSRQLSVFTLDGVQYVVTPGSLSTGGDVFTITKGLPRPDAIPPAAFRTARALSRELVCPIRAGAKYHAEKEPS